MWWFQDGIDNRPYNIYIKRVTILENYLPVITKKDKTSLLKTTVCGIFIYAKPKNGQNNNHPDKSYGL